jgi:DedD protein
VFSSRRTAASLTSGADRWLVLAGAGLLVLGLVLRLLTDIGRSTAVVDTLPPMADSRVTVSEPSAPPAATGAERVESTSAASLGASGETPMPAEPAPPRSPATVPVRSTPKTAPPKTPTTPSSTAAAAPGEWQVQLGVFGQAANAEKLRVRVEALGLTTEVVPLPGPEGERHRVRVVGFRSEAAARAAADSVAAGIGVRGVVMSPGR